MFNFFKRDRRKVIRDNQDQGKRGEERVKTQRELQGWKMTRTGKGHDYKATRTNHLTGKKEAEYVEVKTGNAKLSPLQKKKKRQYGNKYVVENGNSMFDINSNGVRSSSGSSTETRRTNRTGHKTSSPKKSRVKAGETSSSFIDKLLWGPSNTSSARRSTRPKRKTTKSRKNNHSLLCGSGSSSSASLWGGGTKTGRSRKKSRKRASGSIWLL